MLVKNDGQIARTLERVSADEASRAEPSVTDVEATTRRARADAFCQRYRQERYPEIRGVAYTPSRTVEDSDLDSAMRLCADYDDEKLDELARFFLEIPDDREKFLKGKKRTVTMLLNMATPIAERLWGTHAVTA